MHDRGGGSRGRSRGRSRPRRAGEGSVVQTTMILNVVKEPTLCDLETQGTSLLEEHRGKLKERGGG